MPYPDLHRFAATRAFRLDRFQLDACRALEDGRSVLVCAPTGAGKTLVGQFAAERAVDLGGKCFYTTPIKALSNQKFHDFRAAYGAERVGILTGDASINPSAPIVVMTTEVLRNMLYAGSEALPDLTTVVFDEIHYLADRSRGAVWEELLLQLPPGITVVGLSATVSNSDEFVRWLRRVRGDVALVRDDTRPVPLTQHMIVGSRLYQLFADERDGGTGRTDGTDRVGRAHREIHPDLRRAVDRAAEQQRDRPQRHGRRRAGPRGPRPRRGDILLRLRTAGLLPAIVFIFSRAGCDGAVEQCLRSGIRLTSDDERAEIREAVDRMATGLPEADREVLAVETFAAALERGIAAHHAGMLPMFKELVEHLFTRGLVKAVFATETLALGINMPARTVVIERLVKYNGDTHETLTAGEYTQLTGRAGRRGIDTRGHAAVLAGPQATPADVAELAEARTYALTSSFRSTYNMTINLLAQRGRVDAVRLLRRSFAQFRADRAATRAPGDHRRPPRDLARDFDRRAALLQERGYLAGEMPTDRGRILARLWSDSDLLIAECLTSGLWAELGPSALAGAVSTVLFEARRIRPGARPRLAGTLGAAVDRVHDVWAEVADAEIAAGVEPTREPEDEFAAAVAGWVDGADLTDCLLAAAVAGVEQAPGDMVRWCRQVADALDQIRSAAPRTQAPAAGEAARSIRRGIVTWDGGQGPPRPVPAPAVPVT